MTDAPKNGNGNNPTITGAIASVSRTLVTSLPPGFVILVILNLCFLSLCLWFIDHQMASRGVLAEKIITACLAKFAQ